MTTARIRIPPKLIPVFTGEARYRGAYGGRGSAKTRTFAKMTAVRGYMWSQAGESGVIVCGREFQNSLDESSMAEVKAAILSEPFLADYYEVGEKYIRTRDGRIEYKFTGLRHNIDSIKSKALIKLLWVDEAEAVSEGAWRKAIPSVREMDSEVWVTWNPESAKSPTHLRFRDNPPSGSKIVEMNYADNPWFPAVLDLERSEDLARRPDDYAHVWLGAFRTNSEAQVFKNWRVEEFEAPKDAVFRFGADWGFATDPTALVRSYVSGRILYVDREAVEVGCEIDETPYLFSGDHKPEHWPVAERFENKKKREGIPGADKWLIRADSARPETVSYMKRRGYRITAALKGQGSLEDGVQFLKAFDIVVHPRCKNVIGELSLYSYKRDDKTEEVLPLLEDKNNHTIDALRYALEELRRTGWKPSDIKEPAKRRDYGMNEATADDWKTV
jgi:phage terminase large subunit